jgi:hypothetical protein
MTADQRGVYAHRFARVTIRRPRRPMTEAEWQAWVVGLAELPQVMARFSHALAQAFGQPDCRPPTTSPRS